MGDKRPTESEGFDRTAFVTSNRGTLLDFYEVETKALGTGTYGSVVKAVNKATKVTRACKAMARKNIKNESRFREEIRLMKEMDHPNIIRLFETFEDHKNIYLIMELCTGGELFDKIVNEGLLAEKAAAKLIKQILAALYYMHEHRIMHRDLKPENFLFASKDSDAALKVIDFGLGAKFEPGQRMSTKAGTPYYVAPQVLKGNYDEKCDIWSAGVIMFILLSGYPPFYGEKDAEILAKVRKGAFDFPTEEEDGIAFSPDAQDICRKMLTLDDKKRPPAKELLEHPWMVNMSDKSNAEVSPKVISNFKAFHSTQRFKKLALTAIATQLNEKEIKTLKQTFMTLDVNGDGTLTLDEIKTGCQQHQIALPANFDSVFRSIDSDNSGCIDYTEFIAATMENSFQYREDLCWAAFRVFDIDGDGKITCQELAAALKTSKDLSTAAGDAKIKEIISEFDKNGDGCIDFSEFVGMMRDTKLQ
jgi:calcium-dependent protein kinase